MHPATFARTKIQPPRSRAGLIDRTELEQHIGGALLRRRLVLLVAPAGFGKTVALSRQLQRMPADCAIAWVTADEEDDLPRLLSCLVEALEPYDPPWRVASEALAGVAAMEGGARHAAGLLLGTLAATDVRRGVIALDDLHAVSDMRAFEFLDGLLEELPINWTLAIATRVDPPLALARLRAHREVAEFRQDALSFSMEDVGDLCQVLTGTNDPQIARGLYERTEGWPAGVCLSVGAAAAEPGESGPAGRRQSRRHLFDYLASEVLEQMPTALREFLLRCSVLPELTAGRCAVVSGSPRAPELLEDIERRGLFVSVLEGEELVLRLHDLFRDFLEEKLRRQLPGEVPELLRRAAASERDPVRRVHLLLRAGEWVQAEQVLSDLVPELLTTGDSAQVLRLVEQFPQHRRETSPELAYASGLCAWHEFEDPAVVKWMSQAASGFEQSGRFPQAREARLFEAISLLFLGRFEEANGRAQAAIHAAPGELETAVLAELFGYWRAGIYGASPGPADHLSKMADLLANHAPAQLWHRCMPRLYLMVGRPGIADSMQRIVKGAMRAAGDIGEALEAAATLLDTWLLLWQGGQEAAGAAIERLKEQSLWLGQPRSLRVPLLGAMVVFHAMKGAKEGVRAGCEALLSNTDTPMLHSDWRINMIAWAGRQSAAADDWPSVRRALRDLKGSGGTTAFPRLGARALEARYALHEGRNEEALRILRSVVEASGDVDRLGFDASVRASLAVAELRAGSPQAAWRALAPWVEAAGATGEVGGALLCGATMLAELAQARWGSAAPPEGVAVLEAWSRLARQWRAEVQEDRGSMNGVGGRLSAREIEVLQCVAAGQSNKLIARALDLSPHTVKRHVARILDRLDLSSRGEAAAWYQNQRRA